MTYTVDEFLGGKITLFGGDNRVVLLDAPDNSIDAILTDGPYALVSIVKRFGKEGATPAKGNEAFVRASRGFMNCRWDTGEVVNSIEFWKECLRVLKPGGHLLSFGGTRTYHRMACAVEDAGFEVRDMIQWLYGSGFPKSHSVSLAIDKTEGATAHRGKSFNTKGGGDRAEEFAENGREFLLPHEAITPAAQAWEGWGTALKPANEPIVLARKPLSEKTVAANVLKWGTGAINIDGCRIPGWKPQVTQGVNSNATSFNVAKTAQLSGDSSEGRFPANVITDGSDEVVAAFPYTHGAGAAGYNKKREDYDASSMKATNGNMFRIGDAGGSAARFFYQAKANKTDRAGSKHPTVKPIALMRYLARLITPPGGTILDPFAGSGTTGEAAYLEGFSCYLIEMEKEYQADIAARFAALAAPADNDNEPLQVAA